MSLMGSISTEFSVRFPVGFDLNFGHIFASHQVTLRAIRRHGLSDTWVITALWWCAFYPRETTTIQSSRWRASEGIRKFPHARFGLSSCSVRSQWYRLWPTRNSFATAPADLTAGALRLATKAHQTVSSDRNSLRQTRGQLLAVIYFRRRVSHQLSRQRKKLPAEAVGDIAPNSFRRLEHDADGDRRRE